MLAHFSTVTKRHQPDEKEACQQQYWCNGYGWMDGWDPSAVVALVTWRVVNRNDHVDTAEDDDGLMKGVLQPWMILEHSVQCMQQLFCNHGWMKDDYAGSNKEYNDTLSLLPRFYSPVS
ncbi:predicted protein [Lichtheimia corymbifera JMRC:FSU:9682]|uniref:Uncharacterized protein n=1 Tax=Lichtheimia corymbifera JMRC:FSU:9682 TaxID=1263082 RepID=A0A068RQH5_9FUNG|nr:predicted protein [Lichtheimia corymbifera JMRC:FSU:9682]